MVSAMMATITTGAPNGGSPSAISSASRFCWTPGCDQIAGTFNIQAILSSADCQNPLLKDTINFTYEIIPPFDSLEVISNVFTPNGDGINDYYTLGFDDNGVRVGGTSNPCNDKIEIQIYNRWGTLVYESNEFPDFKWDGTNKSGAKVGPGTYFVLISGTYASEKVPLNKLTVTILDSE